jgi:hypothetical protein
MHARPTREMALEVFCFLIVLSGLLTSSAGSELSDLFRNPPTSARPWVYWFWMNGNITREGITADLEAMQENGIGGCLIMHVKLGDIGEHKLGVMPPDGPVRFMSAEFQELFQHAVSEADRLGLQIDMNNADGFTGSGGPWVPVERSMKKLVWTATRLKGGHETVADLPQGETVLGFYRDVAVIAFPTQPSLIAQMRLANAQLSATHPKFDANSLLDEDPATSTTIYRKGQLQQRPQITISFPEPYTADTLVLEQTVARSFSPVATLEVSDDGETFRTVGQMTLKWYPAARSNTVRFDAVRARQFRLSFEPRNQFVTASGVLLGRSNLVHYWEAKAGYARYGEWGAGSEYYTDRKVIRGERVAAKSSPQGADMPPAIPRSAVLDLSEHMNADGRLSWKAPEGEWTVLRIGYTSTGIKNHPASEGGHGLECDKLHPTGVEAAFRGMLGKLTNQTGDLVGKSFSYAHIDSWEVGIQNWTEQMADSFQQMNGYSLKPFLPLIVAGHAIESNDVSERFLWDLRRTILSMMAKNYLGRMQQLCHEHGLKFSSEAGGRQQFLHHPIDLLAIADLPMGEFWPHEGRARVDGKAAASVAHLYGKPVVGAEAFTGAGAFAKWQAHPYSLKAIGDEAFALGINHFIVHYCVHQAYEDFRPGFAMGPWGIHMDRGNTWWRPGAAWLDYLARCQAMLRQGRHVADVLYFPGEGAPHYFGLRSQLSVPLPEGYDYDGCDRETLMHRLIVSNGQLVAPSGASYRYLMLGRDTTMTPELVERIHQLVDQGARVIAPRPQRSPSLRQYPKCDDIVQELARTLWDDGKIMWGQTFAQIAEADELPADFSFKAADPKTRISYLHRRDGDIDIYFVVNQQESAQQITATFRVVDKRPELWDPETGAVSSLAMYRKLDQGVCLPMYLEPLQSVFVVFRHASDSAQVVEVKRNGAPLTAAMDGAPAQPPLRVERNPDGTMEVEALAAGTYQLVRADDRTLTCNIPDLPSDELLVGPWEVSFAAGSGTPCEVVLHQLASWTDHEDFEVQHYSGTARYRREFELPKRFQEAVLPDRCVYLDLGRVEVIATVSLNGERLATLWKPPFRLDITDALCGGANSLEIAVTNLWPNRLIGDEKYPADAEYGGLYLQSWPDWFLQKKPRPEPRRRAFSVVRHYGKEDPLLPSGLLGPVKLVGSVRMTLE